MQLEELKLLSKLIHSCGVKEIERIIDSNSTFLKYLNNFDLTLFNENDNKQIITNQQTSVFYLNERVIDYDFVKESITDSLLKVTNDQEIYKYFNRANELFGNEKTKISIVNYSGMVIGSCANIDKINITDAKLMELLLKKPEIYASKENSILYAESEKGYAYILGSKNKKQLRF